MNATIHPTACTTPRCTNPPTTTHPYKLPGDEHHHASTTSHPANHDGTGRSLFMQP
ncbi:hypothetical protein [Nocardia cyriacigeorgica]|uniref:hypothetical protein n=1 Tax=Nocardia cyriacigeorgica TaxID=135487 RepID=UPI002456FC2F|nr:hypothetical protein [Nocardia cyriacigeorgica]